MPEQHESLLGEVASYYADKFDAFGETARGVDWNGEESQNLRFEQLCRIIDLDAGFSLNDLGCGYGALLQFMHGRYPAFRYRGFDIANNLVDAARKRYAGDPDAEFAVSPLPTAGADFSVASGIFNVRQQRGDDEWKAYIRDTLDALDANSARGFAFNCLTAYSDRDRMREYLFYADPCEIFDLCKRRYARNVAILHDYGLYEFTVLVRKAV